MVPHFSLLLLCMYVNDVMYGMHGIICVRQPTNLQICVLTVIFFKQDPIISLRSLGFHTKYLCHLGHLTGTIFNIPNNKNFLSCLHNAININ